MATIRVRGKEFEFKSVSGLVYLLLWVVSAASLLLTALLVTPQDCVDNPPFNLGCFLISIEHMLFFLAATILHQGMLYWDIHDLDHGHVDPFCEEQGISWYNSWIEFLLRFLIFITLLVGVGKLSNIIIPSIELIRANEFAGPAAGVIENIISKPGVLFINGCYYFFLFLMLWNALSLISFWRKRSVVKSNKKQIDFTVRVVHGLAFLIMGIFAWVFWNDITGNIVLGSDGQYYQNNLEISKVALKSIFSYQIMAIVCFLLFVDAKFFKLKVSTLVLERFIGFFR